MLFFLSQLIVYHRLYDQGYQVVGVELSPIAGQEFMKENSFDFATETWAGGELVKVK
jgi:hypothetical protein